MNNLLTIMKYTIKEAVNKKVFKIVNIIMCAIIVLICNIPNIINSFDIKEDEPTKEKIVIVDKENLIGEDLNVLNTICTDYEFIIENSLTESEINDRINSEEVRGAIILKNVDNNLSFEYVVKTSGIFSSDTQQADKFSALIKSVEINKQFKEYNIPESVLVNMNTPISYEIKSLENGEGNNNFGIAVIASFILFFAVYFYGYSVSASVSSEKTSRVMETLVTSTTPTNIIIGKTLGMGIVGLMQLVGLILVAAGSYKLFVPEDFNVLNGVSSGIDFSLPAILICILYFILGYIVYAFLNAVTGATVSKAEDVQSANTPISLISLLSFYLAYFTATVPNSVLSKFASIFPFSAAFSMPGRILAGGVDGGEIAISVIILLVTAIILAFISIKVYSAAILHYGNRLKIKDLINMFKQK